MKVVDIIAHLKKNYQESDGFKIAPLGSGIAVYKQTDLGRLQLVRFVQPKPA